MNAAEMIQAAIDRLTELRDQGTAGRWYRNAVDGLVSGHPLGNVTLAHDLEREDVDLIVTLHRTIDAQLAILQYAASGLAIFGRTPYTHEVDLARAILGADQ